MSPSRSAYQRRGTGATHTSVVGIYPWIGYRVNERTTVWGVSGYGRGRLRLTPERGAALTSPMTMRMHAAGAQGQLTGNDSIVGLTLKTDVLQAVTSIDGVETPEGRLAASRADVSRIRSAIEGSRTWTMGRWVNLRPSVEVGIRRDAGDAEQGAGIDVGTGLLLTEHRSGLQIDVRMRRLLMHQASFERILPYPDQWVRVRWWTWRLRGVLTPMELAAWDEWKGSGGHELPTDTVHGGRGATRSVPAALGRGVPGADGRGAEPLRAEGRHRPAVRGRTEPAIDRPRL